MRRKIRKLGLDPAGWASLHGRPELHAAEAAGCPKWNDRSAQPIRRPASSVSTQTNPDPNWWNGFNDPTLTTLIEKGDQRQPRPAASRAARRGSPAERGLRPRRRPARLSGTGSYMREQIGTKRVLLLSTGCSW